MANFVGNVTGALIMSLIRGKKISNGFSQFMERCNDSRWYICPLGPQD